MGKPWKNHGKTNGKPWENHGKPWKTMENPIPGMNHHIKPMKVAMNQDVCVFWQGTFLMLWERGTPILHQRCSLSRIVVKAFCREYVNYKGVPHCSQATVAQNYIYILLDDHLSDLVAVSKDYALQYCCGRFPCYPQAWFIPHWQSWSKLWMQYSPFTSPIKQLRTLFTDCL